MFAMEGITSDDISIDSGVPWGSVLGPYLFLYYINDISVGKIPTIRLCANDTIVYLAATSKADCNSLQQDLNHMATWEENEKCRSILTSAPFYN